MVVTMGIGSSIWNWLTAADQPTAQRQTPQPASPWAPSDALERQTLADLFGLAGRPVTRDQAMKLGPIKKGRKLITGQIAAFPLVAYRGANQISPQPAVIGQLERGRPRAVTMAWIVDALIFHGRAFLEIVARDWTGRPTEFAFVPEWQARTDGAGTLLAVGDRKIGARDWIRIDADDEGLLENGRDDINEMISIKFAARRASQNPVPSIELHQTGGTDLTDPQIDKLIERWAAARQGENGGVAFTNASIETKTHGQAVEQLLISARNQASIDLANHMNLPAWAVDASVSGGSLTYSNVPSRSRELVDYTLTPYMNAIAGRLSMDDVLPAGQWCAFDTTRVLQGDFATRMGGYKSAIDAGIYTADECRQLERGMPLEERTTQ